MENSFCSMSIPEKNIQDELQAADPTLLTENESHSSFQTEQLKALAVMRDNLPEYIVESFVEAGFDTLDVISQIDTNPNSTLEEIQQFITREFMEDVRFKRGFGVTGQFKFLPGHQLQVNNFITKVKEETANSKKLKLRTKSKRTSTNTEILSNATSLKRKKIDLDLSLNPVPESINSIDEAFIQPENQGNVMAKIRQQIVRWQRQHSTDRVARLKEPQHFEVRVDVVGKDNLSLYIICNICGKRCILSTSNEHIFCQIGPDMLLSVLQR